MKECSKSIIMRNKEIIKKIVFKHVCSIGFGEVATYKEIAIKSDKINPRTVGKILGENTNLIAIPCHRIIYSNGKYGGYKIGEDFKKFILEWEKKIVK